MSYDVSSMSDVLPLEIVSQKQRMRDGYTRSLCLFFLGLLIRFGGLLVLGLKLRCFCR